MKCPFVAGELLYTLNKNFKKGIPAYILTFLRVGVLNYKKNLKYIYVRDFTIFFFRLKFPISLLMRVRSTKGVIFHRTI